MDDKVINRY